MRKKVLALTLLTAMVFSLAGCGTDSKSETETPAAAENSSASAQASPDEKEGEAPDYSKEDCWYQIPEITKDIDTFYIYATEYADGSMEKGAPDYASLDNAEVLMGVMNQHMRQASLFEDSTNLFIPLYRQGGMRVLKEAADKNGNIDAAISTIPYGDITAALDYYFENYNEGVRLSLRDTARDRL